MFRFPWSLYLCGGATHLQVFSPPGRYRWTFQNKITDWRYHKAERTALKRIPTWRFYCHICCMHASLPRRGSRAFAIADKRRKQWQTIAFLLRLSVSLSLTISPTLPFSFSPILPLHLPPSLPPWTFIWSRHIQRFEARSNNPFRVRARVIHFRPSGISPYRNTLKLTLMRAWFTLFIRTPIHSSSGAIRCEFEWDLERVRFALIPRDWFSVPSLFDSRTACFDSVWNACKMRVIVSTGQLGLVIDILIILLLLLRSLYHDMTTPLPLYLVLISVSTNIVTDRGII